MNVQELIDLLTDQDPDAQVYLATQPSYPLQTRVSHVVGSDEIAGETQCEEHGDFSCYECSEKAPSVVYIAEGEHPEQPYAPHAVWDFS